MSRYFERYPILTDKDKENACKIAEGWWSGRTVLKAAPRPVFEVEKRLSNGLSLVELKLNNVSIERIIPIRFAFLYNFELSYLVPVVEHSATPQESMISLESTLSRANPDLVKVGLFEIPVPLINIFLED